MHDYYSILNIKYDASKETIKKAFRKEALKWHPDRNKASNATERMQLINEAYLILKDDEARSRYDKEYKYFSEFEQQTNSQEHNNKKQEYTINDEILKDWIKKAKVQARDMVKMSIDDLVGMSKAASSAAWEETKGYILVLIILSVGIMIFSAIQ